MSLNHDSNQEARIIQAIDAIQCNLSSSIRVAARIYDVSYSTLVDRLRGQSTRQQSKISNRKLLSTKEEALLR